MAVPSIGSPPCQKRSISNASFSALSRHAPSTMYMYMYTLLQLFFTIIIVQEHNSRSPSCHFHLHSSLSHRYLLYGKPFCRLLIISIDDPFRPLITTCSVGLISIIRTLYSSTFMYPLKGISSFHLSSSRFSPSFAVILFSKTSNVLMSFNHHILKDNSLFLRDCSIREFSEDLPTHNVYRFWCNATSRTHLHSVP